MSIALELAAWAAAFTPNGADLRLADRALADTVAVSCAAREAPLLRIAHPLGVAGRLAVAAHVLDYDDLHLPSTSHISAVCAGGGPGRRGCARVPGGRGRDGAPGHPTRVAGTGRRLARHLHRRGAGGRGRRWDRDRS